MREIKFRAWDKENKKMITECVPVMLGHTNDLWTYCGSTNEHGEYDLNDFEVMQYTGLKDRSGKEIYGGDIIKWREGEAGRFWNKVVLWKEYNAGFELSPYFPLDMNIKMMGEIIGNIYESPELLDNKPERE